MSAPPWLHSLVDVGLFVFVFFSLLACGLVLTVKQIAGSLRNPQQLVGLVLLNFAAMCGVAVALCRALRLDQDSTLALSLLACAGGAPITPKLSSIASGDMALSVGASVLLMAATIIYLPLALPFMYQGAAVNAWEITQNLLLSTLLPLALGLAVDGHTGRKWAPCCVKISNLGIAILFTAGATLGLWSFLSPPPTTHATSARASFDIAAGMCAILLLILIAMGGGYVLGGHKRSYRTALAITSAQRNTAAAMVVATTSFPHNKRALAMVTLSSPLALAFLVPWCVWQGREAAKESKDEEEADPEIPVPTGRLSRQSSARRQSTVEVLEKMGSMILLGQNEEESSGEIEVDDVLLSDQQPGPSPGRAEQRQARSAQIAPMYYHREGFAEPTSNSRSSSCWDDLLDCGPPKLGSLHDACYHRSIEQYPIAPQASLDLLRNPDWTDAKVCTQYLGPTVSLATAEKLWNDIGNAIPVEIGQHLVEDLLVLFCTR
eukprot:g60157.t1